MRERRKITFAEFDDFLESAQNARLDEGDPNSGPILSHFIQALREAHRYVQNRRTANLES